MEKELFIELTEEELETVDAGYAVCMPANPGTDPGFDAWGRCK